MADLFPRKNKVFYLESLLALCIGGNGGNEGNLNSTIVLYFHRFMPYCKIH